MKELTATLNSEIGPKKSASASGEEMDKKESSEESEK
jgi:hypothetical protein